MKWLRIASCASQCFQAFLKCAEENKRRRSRHGPLWTSSSFYALSKVRCPFERHEIVYLITLGDLHSGQFGSKAHKEDPAVVEDFRRRLSLCGQKSSSKFSLHCLHKKPLGKQYALQNAVHPSLLTPVSWGAREEEQWATPLVGKINISSAYPTSLSGFVVFIWLTDIQRSYAHRLTGPCLTTVV